MLQESCCNFICHTSVFFSPVGTRGRSNGDSVSATGTVIEYNMSCFRWQSCEFLNYWPINQRNMDRHTHSRSRGRCHTFPSRERMSERRGMCSPRRAPRTKMGWRISGRRIAFRLLDALQLRARTLLQGETERIVGELSFEPDLNVAREFREPREERKSSPRATTESTARRSSAAPGASPRQ